MAGDGGVKGRVVGRQVFGDARDDLDRHGSILGGRARQPSQAGLGFHGEHTGDLGWIVGEVRTVARPHLDDASAEPG
nr:hypothetical protein [Nocardiopsis gilva]